MTQSHSHADDLSLPVTDSEGSRWGRAHHILLGFLVFALLIWLLSGFYQVKADEVAIVERLGSYLSNDQGKALLVEQGLHYQMPWPIDHVFKIPVQQTKTLLVDTFFASQDSYADYKKDFIRRGWPREILDAVFDPYLITADKNVVHMKIAVTYRINDAEAWVSTVSHEDGPDIAAVEGMREQLFRQIVQHAMISELARLPVNRVLFEGTEQLPTLLNNAIQKAMELPDPSDPSGNGQIDLGVLVQKVDVTGNRWPQFEVVDQAFQGVLKARSDQQILVAQANQQADAARTQAESQRDTMIRDAQAYSQRVTDEARGESSRFAQVLEQFQNAPDVTRWNVYVEAVRSITGNANRIMFVQPGQKATLMIDAPQFDAGQVPPK
jgi:modulator of FtsH protease HflK